MRLLPGRDTAHLPASKAAERLAFCLPITVNLDHRDFVTPLFVVLHLATFLVVTTVLPLAIMPPVAIALACSVRYYASNQGRLAKSVTLVCDHTGYWVLRSATSEQSVLLEELGVIGSACVFRLRCVGSGVYWITSRQLQSRRDWSRLRVLARLL